MISLQPGIPLTYLLYKAWPIVVIDLKDCFFTIPLHEQDGEKSLFTMPIYNNSQPVKRYHEKILPQEILNSPN